MLVHAIRQFVSRLRNSQQQSKRRLAISREHSRIELLEDRAMLSAGVLDADFGNLGRVVTDATSVSDIAGDEAQAVVIQGDGKMVVGGSSTNFIGQGVIARYNVDGSLDTTFGAGGTVGTSLFTGGINDLVLTADGSILATGPVSDGIGGQQFGVLKLTATGEIDTSFAVRGLAVADFAGFSVNNEVPTSIALQGTNIVVAGTGNFTGGGADQEVLVARFTADGNLDTTFNTTGLFASTIVANESASDVVIDNNNKILIAGTSDVNGDQDFLLIRLTNNGTLDTTFDTDGKKLIDFGNILNDQAFSVVVESGNNIIVAGTTINSSNFSNDFALARLNNGGSLLGGFGTNGLVTTDFGTLNEPSNDQIREIRLQGTNVVAAGFSFGTTGIAPQQSFALARYVVNTGTLDNTLDQASGNGGRVQTDFFANPQSQANALAIDTNGNYVLAGFSGGADFFTHNFAVARFQSSGSIDTTLGNQGRVLTDFSFWNGISHDQAQAVVQLPDGSTLVAGTTVAQGFIGTGTTFGVIAKYRPDGTLDTKFGVGGQVASALFVSGFSDLAVQSDGSILATGAVSDGIGGQQFGVLKLTSVGLLDTTFAVRGLAVADFAGFNDTNEVPTAIVLQGTNIVVVGTGNFFGADQDVLVARFTADGNLDSTFNATGLFATSAVAANESASDVVIDNNNKILIAGTSDVNGDQDFLLIRLTNNGTLDTTFDTDGKKTIDFGNILNDQAFSVVVEAGNNIIVAGTTINSSNFSNDFALARLNNGGSLLGGFGTNGLVTTDFGTLNEPSNDQIREIRLQGTNVVAAGFASQTVGLAPPRTFALARYSVNTGSIDTTLDQNSGNGGRVLTSFFTTATSAANALFIDPNGNFVLAGFAGDGGTIDNFAVTRLTSDGLVDNTFANQGRSLVDFSPVVGPNDSAAAVVVMPDGKLVVAGTSSSPFFTSTGVIARYNPDGSLDPTFGSGGLISSSLFFSGFSDIVALPDGSILATGAVPDGFGGQSFGILKLTPSGLIDTTFAVRGLAVADFAGFNDTNEVPTAIVLQGTNIVVVGTGNFFGADQDVLVARFTADGNLDSTFNATGLFATSAVAANESASDVVIDNNNKILIAGTSDANGDQDFLLIRLTNNGTLDTTFDTDGKKLIDFGNVLNDQAFSVVVEAGNNIIVAGTTVNSSNFSNDFALARLNNGGSLLGGFGTNGLVTTDFGTLNEPSNDQIREIRLQGTNVVAAGFSFQTVTLAPQQSFALARYSVSTGTLDNTLDQNSGNGGRVLIGFFASSQSQAAAMAIDAQGNWILAGTEGSGSIGNFALARLEDAPPPTVTLSAIPTTISESGGVSTITATLSTTSIDPVTVNLTFSGTATLTSDFTRSGVQIVIPAGQLSGSITVTGVSDLISDPNESIIVAISTVTNGTESGAQQVTVTLADTNNAAPTDINLSNSTVAENSGNLVVGTLSATDAPGDTQTFTIQAGGNGNLFTISGNQLRLAASQNFEAIPGGTLSVTVRATDQGGLFFNKTLSIMVTDVNEAPTITGGQTFNVNENATNGTVVGTVSASDPDSTTPFNTRNFSLSANPNGTFAINSTTGQITIANGAGLNFEAGSQIVVGVTLTDGGSLSTTQNVTVNLTDVNEAPTIGAGQSFNVAENSLLGTVVGTVVSNEPDSSAPNNTKNFSFSGGNNGNAFAINGTTGQITVASPSSLNFESTTAFTLSVTVTDGGGLSATQSVTVNVLNVNEAPSILNGQSFNINENSANNTTVGTGLASDPDSSDTVTFSITGGNTGNTFSINPNSGLIRVANSSALNFETTTSFDLQITATDAGSLTSSKTVTINVDNVNEGPSISNGGGAATYNKKINRTTPISVFSLVTVGDADVPQNLGGGTLTLSVNVVANSKGTKLFDTFNIPGISSIGSGSPQISNGQITLQIQLNPNVTANAIQSFLQGITFITKGAGLKSTSRNVSITLADAGGLTASLQQTINIRKK